MTISRKRLRPYIQVLDELGIELVSIGTTSGNHTRFVVTSKGNQRIFIAAGSASDRRAVLNWRRDVRRWLSELGEG